MEGVERALEEAVGDDGVPTGGDDGEAHVAGGEIAFDGDGPAVERVFGLPEAEGEVVGELGGEEAGVPVGELGLGKAFAAIAREHPLLDEGVDVIELGDLDEERGDARGAAMDQF